MSENSSSTCGSHQAATAAAKTARPDCEGRRGSCPLQRPPEEAAGDAVRQQPQQHDGDAEHQHLAQYRRGKAKVPIVLTPPSSTEAEPVPARIAAPPVMTVMKDLAI